MTHKEFVCALLVLSDESGVVHVGVRVPVEALRAALADESPEDPASRIIAVPLPPDLADSLADDLRAKAAEVRLMVATPAGGTQ